MDMRVIPILVFIILILSVQPLQVVADTGDNDANLTNQEETTKGFVFVVVGTVLGVVGYKGGKRGWSNIDKSEKKKDRSQYYLTENFMKLSIVLFLLGILLFVGGIFHIL